MEMTFEPIWDSIIAWYLFLAGLGGGSFIAGAFLRWRYPDAVNMRKIAHLVAPIVVFVGLILLMFDAKGGLLNPLRFALLLHNPFSVMTWGVIFLAGFMIISIIVLILDFMQKPVCKWLEVAGVVFGVCVAMYTGALLGVCRTFPLWNTALLPVLFLVSALSAGAAAVLLIAIFRCPQEFNQVITLKKIHLGFAAVEIVLIAVLLFITMYNSTAGFASVMSLVAGQWALPFWLGLVCIGLIAPAIVEIYLLFIASHEFEESQEAHYISAGTSAAVLVGGFLLRFLIVMAALPITIS